MSAKGVADEYTRWLTLIPDEERDRVADLILRHSMDNFESVESCAKFSGRDSQGHDQSHGGARSD